MSDSVEELWKRFCDAEDEFFAARMALFKSGADLQPLIATSLSEPARRHTGLYEHVGATELLAKHLSRCAAHPNADVREIAEDSSRR